MSASAPTLTLHLRESPRLAAISAALGGLAVAAVLALPAPPGIGPMLAALVALLLCRGGHRRPDVRCVELAGGGRCNIVDRHRGVFEGTLGSGSICLPGLVVLELRAPGGRRAFWLPADAFAGDELRRLRVRLRVAP